MTEVIQKVAINGVVYPFAWGGSTSWEDIIYVTQTEYDGLRRGC